MKDIFVGMAIGAVAGAMIAGNPKAQKVMDGIKNKVQTCSCGCGGQGGSNNGAQGEQNSQEQHNEQ